MSNEIKELQSVFDEIKSVYNDREKKLTLEKNEVLAKKNKLKLEYDSKLERIKKQYSKNVDYEDQYKSKENEKIERYQYELDALIKHIDLEVPTEVAPIFKVQYEGNIETKIEQLFNEFKNQAFEYNKKNFIGKLLSKGKDIDFSLYYQIKSLIKEKKSHTEKNYYENLEIHRKNLNSEEKSLLTDYSNRNSSLREEKVIFNINTQQIEKKFESRLNVYNLTQKRRLSFLIDKKIEQMSSLYIKEDLSYASEEYIKFLSLKLNKYISNRELKVPFLINKEDTYIRYDGYTPNVNLLKELLVVDYISRYSAIDSSVFLFGTGGNLIKNDKLYSFLSELPNYTNSLVSKEKVEQLEEVLKNCGKSNKHQICILDNFPEAYSNDELNIIKSIQRYRNDNTHLIFIEEKSKNKNYYNKDEDAKFEDTFYFEFTNGNLTLEGLEVEFVNNLTNQNYSKYIQAIRNHEEEQRLSNILLTNSFNKLLSEKNKNSQLQEIQNFSRELDTSKLTLNTKKEYDKDYLVAGYFNYPINIVRSKKTGLNIEEMTILKRNNYIQIPNRLYLRENYNVIFSNIDDIDRITNFVFDIFKQVPIGQLKIYPVDLESSGVVFNGISTFYQKLPDVFDRGIITDLESFNNLLDKQQEKINDFVQNKFNLNIQNFYDYNLTRKTKKEEFKVIIIYGSTSLMNDEMKRKLRVISRNANKVGVNIVCINPKEDVLEKNTVALDLSYQNNKFYDEAGIEFSLGKLANPIEIVELVKTYAKRIADMKKKSLGIEAIMPKVFFNKSTKDYLGIPIGINDDEKIQHINIGKISYHGLVAGATGSGKSVLLHSIIMNSLMNFSPDYLNLYLLDFKGGTEFKIYDEYRIPHIKYLALDAKQEFGESILEQLIEILNERSALFKKEGVSKYAEYLDLGKKLPRILVIMDEFQILFNDSTNRKVAYRCAELTKRIVTEGRSYGVHLLMATQSTKIIGELTLGKGTIEQMRIRIGLKCNEADSNYMFSDANSKDAFEKMKGDIGTAVINHEYIEAPNSRFRVSYVDKTAQKRYLSHLSNRLLDYDFNLDTFEGSKQYYLSDYIHELESKKEVSLILGKKIKIAPTFSIELTNRGNGNILVVGDSDEMIKNINENILINSLHQGLQVYWIDGLILNDNDYMDDLIQQEKYNKNLNIAYTEEDVYTMIDDVYRNFSNKSNKKIIIFKNIQFNMALKKIMNNQVVRKDKEPEKDFSNFSLDDTLNFLKELNSDSTQKESKTKNEKDENISLYQKFKRIVEEGYMSNLYTVLNATDFTNLRDYIFVKENLLPYFSHKMVFNLNEADCYRLIPSVAINTGTLDSDTVYYYDGKIDPVQVKIFVPLKDK